MNGRQSERGSGNRKVFWESSRLIRTAQHIEQKLGSATLRIQGTMLPESL
jgi:hypothetical protein